MSTQKTTVSLTNTPVQRALAKAKRSTLILLFATGIAAGFAYKACFQDKPGDAAPPAAATARP